MAERARRGGLAGLGEGYEAQAREAEEKAAVVRQALLLPEEEPVASARP
jgi:hypothetical protein